MSQTLGLPMELCSLVDRCLAREPSRRPHAQDLALELERVASGGASSITARVIGNWVERLAPAAQLFPLPAAPPPAAPTPAPEPRVPDPALAARFAPSPAPQLAPQPPPDVPSELAPSSEEPPRARWPIAAVAVLLVLVLGGFGGRAWLYRRTENVGVRQVMVTSTPSGATVRYGGKVLGTTPWAGDLPALNEVELEISAPGFQPVRKMLPVGDTRPVEVSLKKRP